MKIIKVLNCRDCPFANNDNERGYNFCNLDYIKLKEWEELPRDKRHDKCSLSINNKIVIY